MDVFVGQEVNIRTVVLGDAQSAQLPLSVKIFNHP